MFSVENLMDLSGLAGSAVGILQGEKIHRKEVADATRRHEESLSLATAQHVKDMKVAKQTYLMSAFTTLEQHFQQLNADLISSSKESESDMFDQRNQCFQTVILSATIMFSSLVTVIFQGYIPAMSGEFIYVSYALTSALAFAFLFLSIVLCVEVLLRASGFMYNRATNHTQQLRDAMQKTKMMMKKIRGGGDNNGEDCAGNSYKQGTAQNTQNAQNVNNGTDTADSEKVNYAVNGTEDTHFINSKASRLIAEMGEKELEVEWERHEAEVHKYLEEREKINDQTSVLVSADANSSRMSFEQFWRESCKVWGDVAILFFYAGTANLLLAIMIYMWSEFFMVYNNVVGAIISVLVIGISIVVGITLYFFLRQNNSFKNKQGRRKSFNVNGSPIKKSNSQNDLRNRRSSSRSRSPERRTRTMGPRQGSLELDPSLMQ